MADDGGGGGTPDAGAAVDPILWRAKLPLNDLGNAERFCSLAQGRLRYVEELKGWLVYDGRRWTANEGDAAALACAQRVVADITASARALAQADGEAIAQVFGPKFAADGRHKELIGALYAWAIKTGNAERTSGMVKQARGLSRDGVFLMRAQLDDFDVDPLLWHCANGSLRFERGAFGWIVEFEPGHRPGDMLMQIANVSYDPEATCAAWTERFEALQRDPVQRTAIQRIYGMTLTGLTSDQAFYVFQGKGGDGKSMTNAIIADIQGDYYRSASPQTFLEGKQRGGSEHQADIVRLKGDIRLVIIDEPPEKSTWNGERIKQVTGSKITARAPNAREDCTYAPRWKLIAECNSIPKSPGDDRGFRRRFKMYPWQVQFGVTTGMVEEAFDIVRDRLLADKAGILNWMIAGAIDWLNERTIPVPELSQAALASYWSSESIMGDWIEARCDLSDPDIQVPATELYNDFKSFCVASGTKEEAVISQTRFGTLLTNTKSQ